MTRAKREYGLTDADLAGLTPPLLLPNPHYAEAAPMKLYLLKEVRVGGRRRFCRVARGAMARGPSRSVPRRQEIVCFGSLGLGRTPEGRAAARVNACVRSIAQCSSKNWGPWGGRCVAL